MLANAEHARKEITLDEATAERLNKATGSNMFHAGDRVRIAFDPETGGITLAHAQSGIYRFKQDGSLESTQYNKEGLKKLADRLDKEGHHNVASYLREELIPRLREGEVAQVNLQQDKTGKIATADIRHGSMVYHFDTAKREWGMTIQDWDGKLGDIKFDDAARFTKTGDQTVVEGIMHVGDKTYNSILEKLKEDPEKNAGLIRVLEGMEEGKAMNYKVIAHSDTGKVSEIELEREFEAEEESVGRTRRVDEDTAIKQWKRGEYIDISEADIRLAVVTGNSEILASKYKEALEGSTPTQKGLELMDKQAEVLGGYGKISQSLIDKARAGGHIKIDVPVLGKFFKKLGVDVGADGGISKDAIETIDANTLKLAATEFYVKDIMAEKDPAKRAEMLAEWSHGMYELLREHGKKSTGEQLISNAPNPLKENKKEDKLDNKESSINYDMKR